MVLGPRCLCYPAAPVEPPDRPQILWIWVCGCLGTLRSSGSGCPDPQILWIWDPKTLRSEDLGSRACLGHLDLGVSMSIWPRILRIQDQYVLCTRTSEGRLLGPADLVASRHLYLSLCPIWGIASWRCPPRGHHLRAVYHVPKGPDRCTPKRPKMGHFRVPPIPGSSGSRTLRSRITCFRRDSSMGDPFQTSF